MCAGEIPLYSPSLWELTTADSLTPVLHSPFIFLIKQVIAFIVQHKAMQEQSGKLVPAITHKQCTTTFAQYNEQFQGEVNLKQTDHTGEAHC